mmetsp:Transcript_9483/g.42969  ORF Transcript_9483/g.42969 Transcript_9483/m.42969 type:complete len:203 (+) Transcript_9483:1793-2401(+)
MGLWRVARAVRGTAEEFPRGREGPARVRLSQLVDAANLDRAAGVGPGDRLDPSVGGVERPAGGIGGGDDAGCGRRRSLRRISTGCGWRSLRRVAAGGGWRSLRRPGGVHSRVRRRALRRGCHTGCARVRRALRRTRGVNPGERRRTVRCVSARRGWWTLRRRVSASCRRWHVRCVSARGWRRSLWRRGSTRRRSLWRRGSAR